MNVTDRHCMTAKAAEAALDASIAPFARQKLVEINE